MTVCEDEHYFINIATSIKHIKVCYINYYLYYYISRENFGQTRNPASVSYKNGMSKYVSAREKILKFPNLSAKVRSLIKGGIYHHSVIQLWLMRVKMSSEAHNTFRMYMREYARLYYFGFPDPVFTKVKAFVKHVLVLLHIHK